MPSLRLASFTLCDVSRFMCVGGVGASFLFTAKYYSIAQTHPILFISSSVDGPLRCVYLLSVMNNTVVNIGVPVFVWTDVFISLG